MNSILEEEVGLIATIYGKETLQNIDGNACTLFLSPYTGEHNKSFIGVTVTLKFSTNYPFVCPDFHIDKLWGLAEEEISLLGKQILSALANLTNERKSSNCKEGILFQFIDHIKDIISEYNDHVKGSCSICLDDFSDIHGICTIKGCFHKFHSACLQKFWYMERTPTIDEYGVLFLEPAPLKKVCPICRYEADEECAMQIKDYKNNGG